MGLWHSAELARAGGTLIGIADPSPARAGALAARTGAAAFGTLSDLLEHSGPDVVHVCAPLGSHSELIEQALRAGAHVLVEKPMALDGDTTESLLGSAHSAGLLLCPVHQYLFQAGFVRTERALDRLGSIVQLELDACSAGALSASAPQPDAVAADILPHPLSVAQRLIDGSVDELDWTVLRPRSGELLATAACGGATLSLRVSMNGRPPRNEMRATCEGGTARADFFHGYATLDRAGPGRRAKVLGPFRVSSAQLGAAAVNLLHRGLRREPAYPGLRPLIERFYAAIRSRGPLPVPAADALAVARARDRLLSA